MLEYERYVLIGLEKRKVDTSSNFYGDGIMSNSVQLPQELAEYWGKLTPRQQSLMLARIKALAFSNEHLAAMEQHKNIVSEPDTQADEKS